ncbi:MAG: ATPase, T2SS/T4P/T4SS family, partial [Lactococcus lactis]
MAKELIQRAIDRDASDIYLIASKEKYKLYFRQMTARDLVEEIGLEVGLALLTHFKFLAGMNTGERRRVQLGACWYEIEESNAKRLRLSTVGDFEGNESLVIRLLHDQNKELDFWFDEELENYDCKRGLHLFAGPVGSGKTSLM